MNDISQKLWMAAASVLVLSLIVGGLIFGFARTTPANEGQMAAQAAFPTQEITQQEEAELDVNVNPTDGSLPADDTSAETEPLQEEEQAVEATADVDQDKEFYSKDASTDAAVDSDPLPKEDVVAIAEAFDVKTGEELYEAACQSCHQPGGVGAFNGAGRYPALANNPNLKTPAYPIALILYGNGAMPPFAGELTDEQVAMLVNYIRTDLNNFDDKISAEDVAPNRTGEETDLGDDAG